METLMKRFALITLLCYVFLIRTHALALDTIRITYSSVNPHALLVSMAEKRGLYAKYGLSSTIVYVSGGSTAIQAMVSGDIDLGQLTGAPGSPRIFAARTLFISRCPTIGWVTSSSRVARSKTPPT